MRSLASFICTFVVCTAVAVAATAQAGRFVAQLSGDNDVPAADTLSRGQALFELSSDGSALHYKLIVANIESVTQSHIHLAPAGQNGPVTAFLFGFVPEGATVNGILAQGMVTDSDLVGPLAGQTIADLVAELEAGNAYVNVHTQALASGEIRGQIR